MDCRTASHIEALLKESHKLRDDGEADYLEKYIVGIDQKLSKYEKYAPGRQVLVDRVNYLLARIAATQEVESQNVQGKTAHELSAVDGSLASQNQPTPKAQVPEKHQKQPDARAPQALETRDCIACSEAFPIHKTAKVPCGHRFCGSCMIRMFAIAIKNESSFPPKCDNKPIPLDDARRFLSDEQIKKYKEKSAEYQTEYRNRIYCHKSKCGSFIPQEYVGAKTAKCQQCGEETCPHCKGGIHRNKPCSEDKGHEKTLAFIKQRRWKDCPKCGRTIEREMGTCNKIKCYCGQVWCYDCGFRGLLGKLACRCDSTEPYRPNLRNEILTLGQLPFPSQSYELGQMQYQNQTPVLNQWSNINAAMNERLNGALTEGLILNLPITAGASQCLHAKRFYSSRRSKLDRKCNQCWSEKATRFCYRCGNACCDKCKNKRDEAESRGLRRAGFDIGGRGRI